MPTQVVDRLGRLAPPGPRISKVDIVTVGRRPAGRRSRRPAGRAAVLAGAAAFVAIQAALNLAVTTEVVPVRDPVFAEKAELLRAAGGFHGPRRPGDPPRVLAVGSSRTQLGFDPAAAAAVGAAAGRPFRAFNFGCQGAGPLTCGLYLRRLLAAGAGAEGVTVEIHPGFVGDMPEPYEARWLHRYRLRPDEVAVLRGYGWHLPTPPHHGWKGWLTASAAFRYALLNRYAPVLLPCPYGLTLGGRGEPTGWVKGREATPQQRARGLRQAFAEYAPTFAGWRPGGPGVAAIRDMLAQCRRSGMRAAVVLMPEAAEYRAFYGDGGDRRVGELAAGLGREFGVPVVDARGWVPADGFSDGHHLTEAGARTYTARLARDFLAGWAGGGE